MKKIIFTVCLFCAVALSAQKTYVSREQTHLCGPFNIADLEQAPYAEWFNKNYDEWPNIEEKRKWAKKLKDVDVEIYLGTWCGDSKRWVPRFVKLWDDLGLDRDQLKFVGLYNIEGKHKQGPNGEEQGKKIFRVPTFIFDKEGLEIGRIIEFPASSLEINLAQIALGYPSNPSYEAANYLLDLFESQGAAEVKTDINSHYYYLYKRVKRSNELNSLGYLLMGKESLDQALIAFQLNTFLFKSDPNVFDSYAEALMKAEMYDDALTNYEKAVKMNPDNENAITQIVVLKEKIGAKG